MTCAAAPGACVAPAHTACGFLATLISSLISVLLPADRSSSPCDLRRAAAAVAAHLVHLAPRHLVDPLVRQSGVGRRRHRAAPLVLETRDRSPRPSARFLAVAAYQLADHLARISPSPLDADRLVNPVAHLAEASGMKSSSSSPFSSAVQFSQDAYRRFSPPTQSAIVCHCRRTTTSSTRLARRRHHPLGERSPDVVIAVSSSPADGVCRIRTRRTGHREKPLSIHRLTPAQLYGRRGHPLGPVSQDKPHLLSSRQFHSPRLPVHHPLSLTRPHVEHPPPSSKDSASAVSISSFTSSSSS